MHRRILFPLAAGIVGLVALSPVVGAEPAPWAAEPSAAKATTTTAAADDSSAGTTDPDGDTADPGTADPGTADPGTDPDSGAGSGSGASSTTATSGKGSSATTATTATTGPRSGAGSGSGSSSANCSAPVTDRGPAPQVGDDPQTHEAGDAGQVEVERLSATELRISKASPNDGWTHTVTAPSGARVNVRFSRSGESPSLIRFAASMDQAGNEIHVRVTSCG